MILNLVIAKMIEFIIRILMEGNETEARGVIQIISNNSTLK